MRKNFGKKTWFYPLPVLIIGSYDEDGRADAAHVKEADYVGLVSAKEVADKMEKADFHTIKSEFVDAPLIEELPMALECKFIKVNEDGNIIGEIINVNADEKILGNGGVIDTAKLDPISFDPVNNAYVRLGEKVGNAFSDGADLG